MKLCVFINQKTNSLICLIFLCGVLYGGCASLPESKGSESKGGNDFQKQYRSYQGYVRAGHTALNKKRYIEAIDNYSKAIEISPFVASHYYHRGLAWYRKGDKKRAIKDLDKVTILDPRYTPAYVYRGLCRMKREEYREALGDYKSALRLKPKDASIHNNLAWLYATAKDEKFRDKIKALEHAKKAATLSKERNAEILDTLARAYFINGKVKEAVETQKKVVKLEPGNEAFRKNLGFYEKDMKK